VVTGIALLVWLVRSLVLLLALVTLLPLLPVGFWPVRLCDFPRVQFGGLAIVGLLGGCVWVSFKGYESEPLILASILLVIAGWQFSHVLPFTPLEKKELPDATSADHSRPQTSVAVVNLQFDNKSKNQVVDQLAELQVDLLLLIEVNQAWQDQLSRLAEQYPFRVGVVLEEGLGIYLWSKIPLVDPEVRYLVTRDRPSVFCKLQVDQRMVHFVGVHPTPPGLRIEGKEERHDSRIRDAELVLIAKEVAKEQHVDWLITGDFNDVAWSHTTRLFKRLSGLKDPRVGRGLYTTYHAKHPLMRFPIDQVFISPNSRILAIQRFHPPGADHFALKTSFILNGQQPMTPTSDHEDQQDARQLVEEGQEDALQE
jgi:endonuclease/exonuclease/phosphatase (EEP) superfamily protein YafD